MRAVITGGAGFIGSHVAERFAQEGYELCILDNLTSGKPANINPSCKFFETDVCDYDAVNKIVQCADVVVHLAAFTEVPESFKLFRECYRTNVEGTFNVVEACVRHDVTKVVFASSSAVYAEFPEAPKSEDECPEPISPYAISKLEGEHLLQIFENFRGLNPVSLRFFNVYGPGQSADSVYAAVIPAFIQCSLRGQSFTIYGDGHQTRDFVFVKDVAEAVYQATTSDVTGIYNVGTGLAIEVIEIGDAIARLMNTNLRYNFEPKRPGDIGSSTADVARIKRALEWSPSYSLEQGLRETLEWYQQYRGAAVA